MNDENAWEAVVALGLVDPYFVLYCISIHPGTGIFSPVDLKAEGAVSTNSLNNLLGLMVRRATFTLIPWCPDLLQS